VRDWLRSGKVNGDWTEDPPDSIAPDHWRDLEVGAAFILARDAALAVLDAVEARVRADPARKLELDALRGQVPGKEVEQEVASFREAAAAFMAHGYDPSPDALATDLCVLSERPSAALVSDLVERDGTGLVLRGSNIRPGPAFPPDGATIDALRDGSDPEPPSIVLPPGVSPRVRNLWTLDLDLRGELSEFLAGDEE